MNHSWILGAVYMKTKSLKKSNFNCLLPCQILEFGLSGSSLYSKQSLLLECVTFIITTAGMPVGQEDHTCFLVKSILVFFGLDD